MKATRTKGTTMRSPDSGRMFEVCSEADTLIVIDLQTSKEYRHECRGSSKEAIDEFMRQVIKASSN